MKGLLTASVVLFLGLADQTAPTLRSGVPTSNDTALAVAAVPRFGPDRFPSLPPTVRQELVAMNCQVPQPSLTGGPSNVIEGEFAVKGQRDWAALCSDGSTSSIRLVWGGDARCEGSLGALQDSDVVIGKVPADARYNRALSVASIEHITRYLVRRNDASSEAPSHDGIEDRVATGGIVHYCREGRWLAIPGE